MILAFILTASGVAFAQAEETPGESDEEDGADGEQTPAPVAPPPTIDELLRDLQSVDVLTRVNAIRALGERRDPAFIEPLANVVNTDPVVDVRGWALRALHQIDTMEARRAATEAVRDDNDERMLELAVELFPVMAQVVAREEARENRALRSAARPVSQARDRERAQEARVEREEEVDVGHRMRVAGWATFGLSYAAAFSIGMAMVAIEGTAGLVQVIPLVGGIIGPSLYFSDASSGFYAVSVILAAAQIAGFIVAIIGHSRRRRAMGQERRAASARAFTHGMQNRSILGSTMCPAF